MQPTITAAAPVDLNGIQALAVGVLGLMFIIGAICMIPLAHKARSSKMAGLMTNYFMVAIVAALGIGTLFLAIGGDVIDFVRGTTG